MSGDVSATDEVIPAKKRRMNHIAPKIKPKGIHLFHFHDTEIFFCHREEGISESP